MSTTPSNSNPQNSLLDEETRWLIDLKRTGESYADINERIIETRRELKRLKQVKKLYQGHLTALFKPPRNPLEEDWAEEEALREFVRNYKSSP